MTLPTVALVVDERAEIAAELFEQRIGSELDLQTWYLQEMGKCEFMADRIKEQAEKMLREVESRKRALEWRFGQEFRALVEKDLEQKNQGKAKPVRSMKYLTGTAGFRTAPAKLIVLNAKALMDWASLHVPEAVKMEPKLHVTPIRAHIEATGEIVPGCDYRGKMDRFYPSAMNKELPDGSQDGTSD